MVTRVNGFSGMDIDSMVKSMMATKNLRLDRLNQDKQVLQWQRESYRDLSSKLYDFRINKLTTKYGNSSALNANNSVVSGNTTAVKAVASASATTAEMKVSVEKLASAKTLETSGLGQGISRNTFLANLDGVELSAMNESDLEAYLKKGFDITINGVSFKDKDGNSLFNGRTTISSFISTVNSNSQADVFASYDEATGKLSLASRSGGAAGDIKVETPSGKNSLIALFSKKTVIETNGAGENVTGNQTLADLQKLKDGKDPEPDAPMKGYSFMINGASFVFNETETISSVVSKINSSTQAGVVAAFDDKGKLTITANSGNEIKMGGNSYEFLSLFKGAVPFKEDANALKQVKDGLDAKVKVNGQSLENIRTNTFTINGVQLTLQEETDVDNPVIIKNQTDPDKALESIKGFIDDYNNLIKSLNSTIRETKYADFKPLTDEQKKEMKESEILTWTDKAKSGLLKNNDIIKSLLSDMRSIISEKLGPLNSIGITTGLYSENGKLVIKDEAKLKTALSSNPQAVIDLFQGADSAPNDGIFDKLADKASVAIQRISDRSGTNRFTTDVTSTFSEENPMGRQLKQYNSRIALMQRNIASTEDRYYKQFAAMEKAMSQMQSQSASLLAKLGN
ncbi:flagellar filament capping protein FliD [Paenibacillus barcinonensis]|uniref:Flagellar hook-associated protein 2 n=1 Tax=Paenibacillus barcinonensis TaxID=198119 RepID=A0A2V4VUF0_PAEBA|nr:flagellar filament capping protein FliD [Paenibacillus barcinonensis]PYE50641.1 flagellar hook-associated protein [Paenibacillus barcinonensis]QKS57333.1 flagellar filament capping protein FliD [Paenibacillus barcinonensis]